MDVPARIVKLCTLIWELERAGDSGFYVDYLDHLRDNQMKDLEKLCLVADSEVVVLTRFVNIKAACSTTSLRIAACSFTM
ncbi:hypothetical protein Tco_1505030 [Tanacetum coccineum]